MQPFRRAGTQFAIRARMIPENNSLAKVKVMKRAHAEDRSIIYLGAVTLVVIATCWVLCLA